jgi:hypothetical protein
VSWRRFNGWEPRSETVHSYDEAGRLIRTVTTVEPEWDDDNRAWAQALLAYEADLCPGCRQPMSETTSADHEGRYVSRPAIRCHRCTASSQASELYREAPQPNALLIPIELRH